MLKNIPEGHFVVLRICAGYNDLNDNLIVFGRWDRGVNEFDLLSCTLHNCL